MVAPGHGRQRRGRGVVHPLRGMGCNASPAAHWQAVTVRVDGLAAGHAGNPLVAATCRGRCRGHAQACGSRQVQRHRGGSGLTWPPRSDRSSQVPIHATASASGTPAPGNDRDQQADQPADDKQEGGVTREDPRSHAGDTEQHPSPAQRRRTTLHRRPAAVPSGARRPAPAPCAPDTAPRRPPTTRHPPAASCEQRHQDPHQPQRPAGRRLAGAQANQAEQQQVDGQQRQQAVDPDQGTARAAHRVAIHNHKRQRTDQLGDDQQHTGRHTHQPSQTQQARWRQLPTPGHQRPVARKQPAPSAPGVPPTWPASLPRPDPSTNCDFLHPPHQTVGPSRPRADLGGPGAGRPSPWLGPAPEASAENAHACALRTAPATQHREVRGRHLGLPHHQERHGQPAVTAGGSGGAVGPGRPTPRRRGPKLCPRRGGAAVPLGARPSRPRHPRPCSLGGCTARSWRLPPSGSWKRRSRFRPLVVAELCAAYAP